jgi:O-antigen ligase/tetratricopeptide (TPR) repeat protein
VILIVVLLALALLLAPILSGVPDEPLYSSLLCVGVLIAACVGTWQARDSFRRASWDKVTQAFLALLGIALLSLLWRVIADRGIAFLGPMVRGAIILGTEFALFTLARRMAGANRIWAYVLLFAAVLSAAYVADNGLGEYLLHKHAGQADWRVFATSTPDFLAGYLVLLLPPTLALFLGVPWRRDKLLLSVSLIFLLTVLLRTQSRFALVSLLVGVIVFGLALWRARRSGLVLEASSRWRLVGVGIFIILFAVGFARPVLARLRHTSTGDNSTAFRLYTWRGCLKMAEANPVLGTGVGSWVDFYPRYAVTGFTRLAHNGYLQMTDECGLPGIIALLATLGFVGVYAWRGLSVLPQGGQENAFLEVVAPGDDRFLLAGLLGGLAASGVQNLIDSDWYVFFLGLTFWAFVGLALGLSDGPMPAQEPPPTPPQSRARVRKELSLAPPLSASQLLGQGEAGWSVSLFPALTIGITALLAIYMGAQTLGAYSAQQGRAALDANTSVGISAAEQDYAQAMQWDPLNGQYAADLGLQVYFQREGRLPDAIATLHTATHLEPSSLNYVYLGSVLNANHQFADSLNALKQGLQADPNSVEIRLTLSQMLPPPQSVDYCSQITVLEDSPVGRVRALGDTVEYRFAIADACVADADAAAHDTAGALRYYTRAESVLEAYAHEGGTNNVQRQVLEGGRPDPKLDAEMRDLYAHVMTQLIALSTPAEQALLRTRFAEYQAKFAQVFMQASKPGNT